MAEATAQRIAVKEAFLRRAALVDGPFMLKGSYVTSQQIDDWVGLDGVDAGALTAWLTAVTGPNSMTAFVSAVFPKMPSGA
ncbi:hypothetical protein CR152_24550 [Massilia violaceinigra]|uniref:Uncharacterized protein n=1 Tax=Massilia violaceinigra TaxID=2045208 RepID=A0A2D2DQS3_9BURK|nr:hypothetical protein [Massilia violaceinigra]ATQ77334.1 hypothetical protein CR152_24550 [Massilia violaceinigra]